MLTRIVCPNCGHVGATAGLLPRVLICSQCGHGALIRSGKQASSHITREEDAERAAWMLEQVTPRPAPQRADAKPDPRG